jgi:Zn-dependent protease
MMLIALLILFVSIVFHEYAHGWVAYKLGDPTAKEAGRLTLNPLKHIDIFGTIILPFILFKMSGGSFALGYAKPVPINPYHFKNPRRDVMWVGLAGPFVNFLTANFLLLLFKLLPHTFLSEIFLYAAAINLILAVFNLTPIPPLDGSRIITAFLPYKFSMVYLNMGLLGSAIIMLLIFLGFINWLVIPVVNSVFSFWGMTLP